MKAAQLHSKLTSFTALITEFFRAHPLYNVRKVGIWLRRFCVRADLAREGVAK